MTTEAALVARLEVRMDKFEKQMRQAGVIADRGVRDIEERFERGNPVLGRAIGAGLGLGIAGGVVAGIRALDGLMDRFKALEEIARVTGIELHRAFAIQQMGGGDVGPEAINRALERMNTLLDQAKRGGDNSLSKLFAVNNADLKSVKDVGDLWERVADFVRRAETVEHGRQIAEAAGAGRDLERALGRSAEEAQKVYAAAESARPAIEQLARLSEDFNQAWKGTVEALKEAFLSAWPEIKAGAVQFINDLQEAFETLANYLQVEWARKVADALNNISGRFSGTIGGSGLPVITVNKGAGAAGGFSRPPAVGGGRGGSGSDRLDAFEREGRRARERTAQMELETRLVGATAEARARELEILRLMQMAEREKIPLTEAVRMRIDEQAEAYGRAAGALDRQVQRHREFVELQNFAGNQLVDIIDRAVMGGEKLSDVMADVARMISRAALQAALLGQGPLSGLFGTGGQGGAAGGLVGAAFAALPRFAQGGVVPGSGPVPIMAHGGEVVVPKNAVRAGGVVNNIEIIAPPGSSVSRSERRNGAGGVDLKVVIDQAVAEKLGEPGSMSQMQMRRMGARMPLIGRG